MAAEANNKYAETVTKEEAIILANKAIGVIDEDCFFLSHVAEKCDTYRDKFQYILEKFSDDPDVFEIILKMKNKCESILVQKAAKGKEVNPIFGIFVLKSYHNLIETSKLQAEVTDSSQASKKAMTSNENDTQRESA